MTASEVGRMNPDEIRVELQKKLFGLRSIGQSAWVKKDIDLFDSVLDVLAVRDQQIAQLEDLLAVADRTIETLGLNDQRYEQVGVMDKFGKFWRIDALATDVPVFRKVDSPVVAGNGAV